MLIFNFSILQLVLNRSEYSKYLNHFNKCIRVPSIKYNNIYINIINNKWKVYFHVSSVSNLTLEH